MARSKKHIITIKTTSCEWEAEYKEGEYVKFPYDTLNIVVYKPGKCETVGRAPKGHYADAAITIGKKASDPLTVIGYDDLPVITEAIDYAIDILNSEGENLIEKTKITRFDNII